MEGTRIVLVRHGESRAQELGVLGGHTGCTGLSDLGREQVGLLRDRLLDTGELADASALYASLMPRAIETAEILAPALGGLDVRRECDFCEGHPGEADGLTWAELDERYPVDDTTWANDSRRAPGWETWQEMGDRVGRRARPRSWSGTRARRSSWRATAAWWCTRCSTSCRSTLGRRPRVDRARQLLAHRVALRTEPLREGHAPGPAGPVQRPRPPRRARCARRTRSESPAALHRGRDPAGVDVVVRLQRAHGQVDGAPQRLRRAEEQQRRDPATGSWR